MIKFFKDPFLQGLYVLLPVLLLWIGIREIADVLVAMASPIADIIGSKYFDDVVVPGVVAIVLIGGTSILFGILVRLNFVAAAGQKMETAILNRVPMYQMLKVVSSALVRPNESTMLPALIDDGEGGGDPCYVMEDHGDGLTTVLMPWSPTSFAGSIKVIPSKRLKYIDCTVDEYSHSVSLMGVGIAKCLGKSESRSSQSNAISSGD